MRLVRKFCTGKKIKRTLAAFLSGTMLFVSGTALAAPDTSSEQESLTAAYMSRAQNDISFNEGISFFGPDFKADITANGQFSPGGIIRVAGNLNWDYTDLATKQTTGNTMPFYLEQENSNLTIYAKQSGHWGKMTLPRLTAFDKSNQKTGVNLPIAMDMVKSMKLEKDDATQRTLKITLAGDKLAALLKQTADSSADISHQEFNRRLIKALHTTDVTLAWTTSKANAEQTVSIDLTEIMRAYTKSALDEVSAGTTTLSDEDTKLLESLGYYYELKSYTTYDKDNQAVGITIPADVRRTATEANLFQDLLDEAKTAVLLKQ